MDTERYYFGARPARRLDYYGHARVGSHFLWTCLSGLFDLVNFPGEDADAPEPVGRLQELDPMALYALNLRADDAPFQPVYIDPAPNGMHGVPRPGPHPVLIIIRNPWATVYSQYNAARHRWNQPVDDPPQWVREHLDHYFHFYRAAFALLDDPAQQAHLVRFEDLVAGPEALQAIVDFVGVAPKLAPAFVHWCTRFDRITRPGERTFYRQGDNAAWQRDPAFGEILRQAAVDPAPYAPFGYTPDAG